MRFHVILAWLRVSGNPVINPDVLAKFVNENCGDRLLEKCGTAEHIDTFVKAALKCEGGDLRPCLALIPDKKFVDCAHQELREDWSTCYQWEPAPAVPETCSFTMPCSHKSMTELVHLGRLPGRNFMCHAGSTGSDFASVCAAQDEPPTSLLNGSSDRILRMPDFQDCCEGACQASVRLDSLQPGLEVCVTSHGRVCMGSCAPSMVNRQCTIGFKTVNCAKGQCYQIEHPWELSPTSQIRIGLVGPALRVEYSGMLSYPSKMPSDFAFEIQVSTKSARLLLGRKFQPEFNFRLGCQASGSPLYCSENISLDSVQHEYKKQKTGFFSGSARALCPTEAPPLCQGTWGDPKVSDTKCPFYGFLPDMTRLCETAQATEVNGQCVFQPTQLCRPPGLNRQSLQQKCQEFQSNNQRRQMANAKDDDLQKLRIQMLASLAEDMDQQTANKAVDSLLKGLPTPSWQGSQLAIARQRLTATLKAAQVDYLADSVFKGFEKRLENWMAGVPRETRLTAPAEHPPPTSPLPTTPAPIIQTAAVQKVVIRSDSVSSAPAVSRAVDPPTTTTGEPVESITNSNTAMAAGGFLVGAFIPGICLFCVIALVCGFLCFGAGFHRSLDYAWEGEAEEEQPQFEESGYYYEDDVIDDLYEDGDAQYEYEEDPDAV